MSSSSQLRDQITPTCWLQVGMKHATSSLIPGIILHTSFPRQKQSAGRQAQLYVGGEAANNSRAKRTAKFGPSYSSSQEVLSLHFSYKLGVTIT